jgi:hypothetical protein
MEEPRQADTQIVLPQSKLKDVQAELHGGPSEQHLGVSKTLCNVRQRYYWLHSRSDFEK